jgi:hypothetical protein
MWEEGSKERGREGVELGASQKGERDKKREEKGRTGDGGCRTRRKTEGEL